jgi:cbb3-type cytochrome oxidase subunit 1
MAVVDVVVYPFKRNIDFGWPQYSQQRRRRIHDTDRFVVILAFWWWRRFLLAARVLVDVYIVDVRCKRAEANS